MLAILPKIAFAFVCKLHQKRNTDKINKRNFKETVTIATVALTFSLFSANSVNAASFNFSQEGWQYGGNLSGSFTGSDINNNGKIETSELSVFNATFSGNLLFTRVTGPSDAPDRIFSTISQSLPSLNNLERNSFFEYSLFTSQLSFSSFSATCLFVNPIDPTVCIRQGNFTTIAASNTGGIVFFRSAPNTTSAILITNSSSAPLVTPVQQPIPESSTLGAILFGGLHFLLKRKVVSSRTTTKTTKLRS